VRNVVVLQRHDMTSACSMVTTMHCAEWVPWLNTRHDHPKIARQQQGRAAQRITV
jgi:hypothetical protein